jgi:hypothetical protein
MAWLRRSPLLLPVGQSGTYGTHVSCPLGPAAQEVCLDDPHRLEQWPAICHTCGLVSHAGSSREGVDRA